MTDNLVLVGLSHRRAPVELRERVSLTDTGAAELARELAGDGSEAVCLSTCNRTEVYAAGEDIADAHALTLLAGASGLATDELARVAYTLHGDDVALHLFRVAAGLDSLVPGEGQILGQVRSAFEHGAAGPLLDRMFRGAIHAGRRVRRETAIGEVPASVAAAAAALAEQLFGDLETCSVMLLGAGKTGELAAASLVARGARIELVANRSPAKAREVAERYHSAAVPLDEAAGRLPDVDVVVSSTSSRAFVLTREDVEPTLRGRKGRPLFFIDIAVPRDVDPAVHELDECYVYDIDDLEAVVTDSSPGRAGEAARAEAIVAAEAARFADWRATRDAAPAIASLRARAEEIRSLELERARARLGRLTDAELEVVEAVTTRIVDKLLHVPMLRLKEAAAIDHLEDDAAPGRNPRQ
ncbi:MAG TPA: glutamyl-tRNA reductase [Gaiellaceae bacterium]|nr:glutamyl-tRNA reductase [Gaiellaceae bacterium]